MPVSLAFASVYGCFDFIDEIHTVSLFVRLYSSHETDLEIPNRGKPLRQMPILQEGDSTSRHRAADHGLFPVSSLWTFGEILALRLPSESILVQRKIEVKHA
jgi:hypothetical protein